ncbi:MAG: hypothetical protein JSV15_06240 [Candidatus Bathyarchaeota archaeon]|nr:MAG: hypothetical protein JSV15_06240 [Candidatus Bathyarchaeota archaeon]
MNFEKTLLRAVDDGLLLLGETPRKAIYYHLGENLHLERENIPEEIEKFARALNAIFGSGAGLIEKFIVKELYRGLNFNFEEKMNFQFADYVRQAEQSASDVKQRGDIRLEQK